jgi:hypothetical protein
MAISSQKLLPQTGGGSLAVTRPTANLVPYKKPPGGALAKQPEGKEENDSKSSLEENVVEIRVKTKKIEKIIGRTLKLNKKTMRFEARENQKDLREKTENKKEKKLSGIKMPQGISIPKIGFLERLKNFIGTVLLGRILYLLTGANPQLLGFIKFIVPIGKFIADVVGGLADKLVSAITFGYKVKDKVEEVTKNLFGDEGLKKFKDFQGFFTKFMNLALIAVMIAGTTASDTGFGRGRDRGRGRDLSGRRASRSSQQRYRKRFGDKKYAERFGRRNLKRLTKGESLAKRGAQASRGAQSGVQKFVQKGVTKVAGKAVGKIAGKIPIVGPLIDFGVRAFIFKEPLGKAAAAAVGAAAGQALGTFLGGAIGGIVGSVVPFIGNLLLGGAGATVGGLIGGIIGDQIGVSLYNVIAGKEDSGSIEDASLEAKAKGGVVGEKEYEDAREKRARNARIKRIMPSNDSHMNTNVEVAKKAKGKSGNIFNRLFSFMARSAESVTSFVNPFKKIQSAVKNLRQGNSNIISKIMALGADLIAGKKPDNKTIKDIVGSLVSAFDAAVPAPINLVKGIFQKLSQGGYVLETPQQQNKRVRDLTKVVERKFLTDITRDTTRTLNVIKGIEGKKESDVATGPGGPGGTGPIIPGTRLPSSGATLSGSDKLSGLTGNSGSVAYDGRAGSKLDISYSPFAQSDLDDQASRGGIVITSGKGYRSSTNSNHKGYDVGADRGTPMYAYLDGEVTHVNSALGSAADAGYGYWVVWKDSVHGAYHFFGHLDRPPALSVGTKFKAGALLANVGGSGSGSLTAYDPHLHWEISTSAPAANGQFSSYVDPGQWINTHGAKKNAAQVATNTPQNPDAVAQNASYEQDGTTVAIIEKTKVIRVPVQTSRGTKMRQIVVPDTQVVSPT